MTSRNFQIGLLGLVVAMAAAFGPSVALAQRKQVGEIHVIQTRWQHKQNPRLTTTGRISLYFYYGSGYSQYELTRLRVHKQSFQRVWNWQSDQIISRSPIYR